MTGLTTTTHDTRSKPRLSPGMIAWMVLRARVSADTPVSVAVPVAVSSTLSPGNVRGRVADSRGLYIAVTVLCAVGFGGITITARSPTARPVVAKQTVASLAALGPGPGCPGLANRDVVGAVRHRRHRQDPPRYRSEGP
ncbi:hypothetical protein [Streptomyces sp.]|uniref:hypothetical protein n=1 Tax=Streptomyces sp. TaxID=1931 RepID=UPI002F9369B7